MSHSARETVLVVDDNELGRVAMAQILRRAGFEVKEASTGAEALRLAEGRPDLIVLDVLLPDLCGFDVCRRIKASPATACSLVLHLSGVANTVEDKAQGLEGGADGYLVKPVEPAELVAHVTALLRLRRAEEAGRAVAERLRLIIDTAYDAFVAIDAGGSVIDWNRRAEALFGWSRDEALGRPLDELVIPARSRDKHRGGLQRMLLRAAGQGPAPRSTLLEVTALRKDGAEFPAELMISQVRHHGADLFSAFVRDLGPRKCAERHQAIQSAVSQSLVEAGSLSEATRRIIRSVCDVIGWDAGTVWRVDREANVLRCLEAWAAAGVDASFEARTRQTSFAPMEGLPGRVWATRQPAAMLEFGREEASPRAQEAARAGLSSAVACPIPFGPEVTGVIEFFSRSARPAEELLAILGVPTGQIGQFLERQQAEQVRAEQASLAAFAKDVGEAVIGMETLEAMLQRCAEAMVRHLGAAFARIWLLDAQTNVLRLRASAGKYVHLDGPHSRVPVGQLKIGRIALERKPHFTNDVPHDPRISDKEWARREGMVAFAGHPLVIGDQLVGVMALFAMQPLSDFTRRALASAADHVAGGIQRKIREAAMRATEAELRVARQIQQRLFPRGGPQVAGFDVGGASHPAEATGGDYYDYFPLRDGSLGVAIGDVSGHGLGPALLMASLRASLRSLAGSHADVGEILRLANDLVCDDADDDRFVTLFLARLDPRTHSLAYASAGHVDGYLLDREGKQKQRLKSTGIPLGIQRDASFQVSEAVRLGQGELVLLLTDGIADARSPDGCSFGFGRALSIVRVYRHDPAARIVANLYDAVRAFTQDAPQMDDVSAVVIKR